MRNYAVRGGFCLMLQDRFPGLNMLEISNIIGSSMAIHPETVRSLIAARRRCGGMSRISTYRKYAEAVGLELLVYFVDRETNERYATILEVYCAKHVTSRQLAERLRINPHAVREFMYRQRKGLAGSTEMLIAYAEALGCEFVIDAKPRDGA